jgi:hypothetical protein
MPRRRLFARRTLRAPRELAVRGRERAAPLVEEAAQRSRTSARERARRLLTSGRSIVQVTLAATLAWLVATELLDHPRPFFAPVSAIVTLGVTLGERPKRAIELALGVALGIAVADLFIIFLGTGTAQLALVVFLAMSAALLLGRGELFATQAAVSAALVATLEPPSDGVSFARFLDALVGGSIALATSALVLPADPVALVRSAANRVLRELAGTLDDIADALSHRDHDGAHDALVRARGLDPAARALGESVTVARQNVRWGAPRRGVRPLVETYAAASAQIDLAVRDVRVLARAGMRSIELDDNVPGDVVDAIRELAGAARELEAVEHPESAPRVHDRVARAAGAATTVLMRTGNLSVNVIVGQVRATAVDLLRAAGLGYDEAVSAVREAADEAEERASG